MEHARISVETIEDWERIQANFTATMQSVLNTKLGPEHTPDDRNALLAHLNAWRERTFEAAKYNVRVNGKNLEDRTEEDDTEPYDEALDRELCDLRSDRREWDLRIAKRRRTAPGMVQDLVQDLLERQRAVEYKIQEPKLDDMEVDFEPTVPRLDSLANKYDETIVLDRKIQAFVPVFVEQVKRAQEVTQSVTKQVTKNVIKRSS